MKIKKLFTELHGKFNTTVTSLNAIIDKLPEGVRNQVKDAQTNLKSAMEGMPKPEDLKEDDEGVSINHLTESMSKAQEISATALSICQRISGEAEKTATSLNRLAEFDQKIEKGDLIPKDKHETLVGEARTAGATAAKTEFKTISTRREAVSKCGLPLPTDDALAGTDEEFKVRQDLATSRVTELKAKGISINGVFAALPWAAKPDYDRDVKLIEAAKGNSGNPGAGPAGEKDGNYHGPA
jgi:hypothetical protein